MRFLNIKGLLSDLRENKVSESDKIIYTIGAVITSAIFLSFFYVIYYKFTGFSFENGLVYKTILKGISYGRILIAELFFIFIYFLANHFSVGGKNFLVNIASLNFIISLYLLLICFLYQFYFYFTLDDNFFIPYIDAKSGYVTTLLSYNTLSFVTYGLGKFIIVLFALHRVGKK